MPQTQPDIRISLEITDDFGTYYSINFLSTVKEVDPESHI